MFSPYDGLDEKGIKWWKEHRCSEKGCPYMTEDGFILCTGHLRGFPRRVPQEIIDQIDKWDLLHEL